MSKFLLIAFVLFSISSFGQSDEDVAILKKNFSHYAVVKLTLAFMDDRNETKPFSDKELTGRNSFEKLIIGDFSNDTDYSKKFDDAKNFIGVSGNHWSINGKKVFDKYSELILSGNDVGKFNFGEFDENAAYQLVGLNITTNRAEILHTLQGDLKKAYDGLEKDHPPSAPNNGAGGESGGIPPIGAGTEDGTGKSTNPNSEKSTLYYLFLLISISELLIIIWLVKRVNRLKSDKKGLKYDYKELKEKNKSQSNSNDSFDSLKKALDECENQILILEKSLHEAEGNRKTLKEEYHEDEISEPVELVIESPQENIEFYLGVPVAENKFNKPDAVSLPKPNSLYKFSGGDTGEFEIFLGDNFNYEIPFNSHERYLERVCDYQNALDVSVHRSVKTIVPGKYKSNGDEIIVVKRVKIEFA